MNGSDVQVIRIAPSRGWVSLKLHDLWEYRELLYFLAWRDIKVRYKQTALGAAWAIIQPLTTMVIFTIIFGQLAKIPSDGIPYPIFSFCALLPWNYFAGAFGRSSGSLVGSAHLISKVYFPRLVIPISSLLSGLLDFAIAFVILIVCRLMATSLFIDGCGYGLGCRSLAWGFKCAIPRCWLLGSVLESNLDVCHASGLSQ
jgi:lipopolysaccharide transport system permease protein